MVSFSGGWNFQSVPNPATKVTTTCLAMDPSSVTYGSSSFSADDWSSLEPIRLLDILYLSQNVLVTRANVDEESTFVWKRTG